MSGPSEEAPGRRARDVSAIMRRVRSRDTTPELALRRALWAKGFRYRLYSSKLPGKPDIVLPSRRLAIFIDGDFWHGHQWQRRSLAALEDQFRESPSRGYWVSKIRRNVRRDSASTASLMSEGWTVLRFWESQVREGLEGCVERVVRAAGRKGKRSARSLLPAKTFADFFAGIGLARMALERQGWKVMFANDIDAAKYEMYEGHFGDAGGHYVLGDIHGLDVSSVPSVTLAAACFPCNDLSLAGSREGLGGKQSSAFWGFVRVLEGLARRRPPLVLLENVAGFLSSRKGEDFRQALLALNELGYAVDAFVLDAVRFVPQSRERLFVLGILQDTGNTAEVLEPSLFYQSDVRPPALAEFIFCHPEIRWSLRNLPRQPRSALRLVDILEDLPEDSPEWWGPERARYLLNQMSPRHRRIAEAMMGGAEYSYGTVFRRVRHGRSMGELRTDGIAGCLRTPRGGSGRQILFKAGRGNYFARLLTPRECARLMGADDYRICVRLNQALFGFGDAVCVPVVEWIAEYYLNPLVNELIRGQPLAAYGRVTEL
jgi:DNA (cytosine-5)-methyltransferase 1